MKLELTAVLLVIMVASATPILVSAQQTIRPHPPKFTTDAFVLGMHQNGKAFICLIDEQPHGHDETICQSFKVPANNKLDIDLR